MLLATSLAGWLLAALALVRLLAGRRRLERVARAEHELRGPAAVLLLTSAWMRRDATTRSHADAIDVQLQRLTVALDDLTAARSPRRRTTAPHAIRRHAGEQAATSAPGTSPRDLRSFTDGALAGWAPALRATGRRVRIDWRAGSVPVPGNGGRLAQALGNLVANAAEHGRGALEVTGRRVTGAVRVELRNGVPPAPAERRGRWGSRARVPDRGRGLAIAADAARALGGSVTADRADGSFVAALELPLAEDDPSASADESTEGSGE